MTLPPVHPCAQGATAAIVMRSQELFQAMCPNAAFSFEVPCEQPAAKPSLFGDAALQRVYRGESCSIICLTEQTLIEAGCCASRHSRRESHLKACPTTTTIHREELVLLSARQHPKMTQGHWFELCVRHLAHQTMPKNPTALLQAIAHSLSCVDKARLNSLNNSFAT